MSIIVTIPDKNYLDLATWVSNVKSYEILHDRNKIEIYYYIFSDDQLPLKERPIILCRTISEQNANVCFVMQTYYYKGEYSTIDCICLHEDSYQIAINNYHKYILTPAISKIEFDSINQKNRFFILQGNIKIYNKLQISTQSQIFLDKYYVSDFINFLLFPSFHSHLNVKEYIRNCLDTMTNNSNIRNYYQKLLNLYKDRNLVKYIFRCDHENSGRQEHFEDILSLLDIKINRENIFQESKQSLII